MIQDRQVRKLRTLLAGGMPLYRAALKTGMDEKTARKYRRLGKLPSESKVAHTWRTGKIHWPRFVKHAGSWKEKTPAN